MVYHKGGFLLNSQLIGQDSLLSQRLALAGQEVVQLPARVGVVVVPALSEGPPHVAGAAARPSAAAASVRHAAVLRGAVRLALQAHDDVLQRAVLDLVRTDMTARLVVGVRARPELVHQLVLEVPAGVGLVAALQFL